jgi:hypothetical protein
LGIQRATSEQEPTEAQPAQRAVTTPLPQPQLLPPEEVQIAPAPQVEPAPSAELRPAPTPLVRPAPERPSAVSTETVAERVAAEMSEEAAATAEDKSSPAAAPAPETKSPPLASAKSLRLWPSRVTDGAYGRLVQIGAFGSVRQAKLGWAHMVHAYPGVARLPAVVRPARNSKGRIFYRFQIGTTSQAHSEVLCQRMQKIRFSCAVVGLPWKEKIER